MQGVCRAWTQLSSMHHLAKAQAKHSHTATAGKQCRVVRRTRWKISAAVGLDSTSGAMYSRLPTRAFSTSRCFGEPGASGDTASWLCCGDGCWLPLRGCWCDAAAAGPAASCAALSPAAAGRGEAWRGRACSDSMLRRSSAERLRISAGMGGGSAGALGRRAATAKSVMRSPSGVSNMCSGLRSLSEAFWLIYWLAGPAN